MGVERLKDMPPGTVGFRADGEIEREDYDEVLVPELRRAVERRRRAAHAVPDRGPRRGRGRRAVGRRQARLRPRRPHHDAWVRSAIVTDIEWMARATKMFAWMMPGEARVFPRAQLEQAKEWVAG